jgi:hypothetical protein
MPVPFIEIICRKKSNSKKILTTNTLNSDLAIVQRLPG